MNTKDAVRYIKSLFDNYWRNELHYQCIYDNLAGKAPNANEPYAVFDIFHTLADRAAFMGVSAKSKYRQIGYVAISLYVPANTGVENAYELAQGTMNVYRRPPSDCQVNFTEFSFTEDPERYRDFFRIIVKVKFDYEYYF